VTDVQPSPPPAARRVGPPVLLGLRPRFLDRATIVARLDQRIRALALWGPLARGEADEWSGIDFVATVADESVGEFLDELTRGDTLYGKSLVALRMPQHGVAGGGFVSVTYLQSGLPLHVDWYVSPLSLGIPVGDTKPLFVRDGWPHSGASFAELLRERPSRESCSPPRWDRVVSTIPVQVAEVARGRPEAVRDARRPMRDRTEAYAALARRIGSLPARYRDALPPLFSQLGVARLLNR